MHINSHINKDKEQTLRNRNKLIANNNLYTWYRNLYKHQFENINGGIDNKRVLEIGSGTSPLNMIYPHVMTSDIMPLDYLDYVFDCHNINSMTAICDHSIDVITLTNVLHHLRNPLEFLIKATVKLAKDGILIATEPYFSIVSSKIFKYLHKEPVDFKIKTPTLTNISGPLSSANIALPFLIFTSDISNKHWCKPLWKYYRQEALELRYYSSVSYFLTGGMSYRLPLPEKVFNWLLQIDLHVSRLLPQITASFFSVMLKKSDEAPKH